MAQGNIKRRPAPKGHPVRQAPETAEQSKAAGINFDPDEVTQKTFQRILPYYKFVFFVIIVVHDFRPFLWSLVAQNLPKIDFDQKTLVFSNR